MHTYHKLNYTKESSNHYIGMFFPILLKFHLSLLTVEPSSLLRFCALLKSKPGCNLQSTKKLKAIKKQQYIYLPSLACKFFFELVLVSMYGYK